jgi:excisionase family DNA binding protein
MIRSQTPARPPPTNEAIIAGRAESIGLSGRSRQGAPERNTQKIESTPQTLEQPRFDNSPRLAWLRKFARRQWYPKVFERPLPHAAVRAGPQMFALTLLVTRLTLALSRLEQRGGVVKGNRREGNEAESSQITESFPRSSASRSSLPFAQRLTCTIDEACEATGLGRTKLYELISAGQLLTTTVGRRRLVLVRSLLLFFEACMPK